MYRYTGIQIICDLLSNSTTRDIRKNICCISITLSIKQDGIGSKNKHQLSIKQDEICPKYKHQNRMESAQVDAYKKKHVICLYQLVFRFGQFFGYKLIYLLNYCRFCDFDPFMGLFQLLSLFFTL